MNNWMPGYQWPPQFMIMQAPQSNDKPPSDFPKPDKKEKNFVDLLREKEEEVRALDRYIEEKKRTGKTERKEERKKKWWKLSEVWIAFSFASLIQAPIWLLIFLFLIKEHVR